MDGEKQGLPVAVPVCLEACNPESAVLKGRQHSRWAGVQIRCLNEAADPSHAKRHVDGPVGHTWSAHVEDERLAGRVRASGAAGPSVGLVRRHTNSHQAVAPFPEGGRVDLCGVAQFVGLRQGCIGAGPEGLCRGGCSAGPDPGFHGPAGQGCAPFLERQRDPRPVQSALLCELVVTGFEEPQDLSSPADRCVDGAGVGRLSSAGPGGLHPDHFLAGVLQARPELPEEAVLP